MIRNEGIEWQRIIEVPSGLRHIIIFVISVVIAFGGWFWIIFPLAGTKEQNRHELAMARQSVENSQQELVGNSTLDSLQQQLRLLNSTLEQYQSVADPINIITDILAQSGSRLTNIKKLPSLSHNGFTIFRWNIKSQADYFQFMSFIHLLNASPHIITLERLVIAGDALLTLDTTIHLYQLNMGEL